MDRVVAVKEPVGLTKKNKKECLIFEKDYDCVSRGFVENMLRRFLV